MDTSKPPLCSDCADFGEPDCDDCHDAATRYGRECPVPDWALAYPDTSWGNDACPSRLICGDPDMERLHVRLWIAERGEEYRECTTARLMVAAYIGGPEHDSSADFETDDENLMRDVCEWLAAGYRMAEGVRS